MNQFKRAAQSFAQQSMDLCVHACIVHHLLAFLSTYMASGGISCL